MIAEQVFLPEATDGDLFTINLNSSLSHQRALYQHYPDRLRAVESILDAESNLAQFFGDYSSLDRMKDLADRLLRTQPEAASTYLIAARVNSARHLFAQANDNLMCAQSLGVQVQEFERIDLGLQQALGHNLEKVLQARECLAEQSWSVGNLVPLGAVLADLGRVDAAHAVYLDALRACNGLSPLGPAWACFQLGFLCGELQAESDIEQAAYWYAQALRYLPGYTHAAVHLAEIHIESHSFGEARKLLESVLHSGDPEVRWRLSDLCAAQGHDNDATTQNKIAATMYEELLSRHELAFADHAAEFYLGSGANPDRALQLALVNLSNRFTRRACTMAIEAAKAARQHDLAVKLTREAHAKWRSFYD
jgi:tetratricopeptide (TPR) repeat protein